MFISTLGSARLLPSFLSSFLNHISDFVKLKLSSSEFFFLYSMCSEPNFQIKDDQCSVKNKPTFHTKVHPEYHRAGIITEIVLTESKSKCHYLLRCCNFRRHHVWLTAVLEHPRSALTHHLRGTQYDLVSLSRWLWVTASTRELLWELLHTASADMFIERAACRDKRLKMGKA